MRPVQGRPRLRQGFDQGVIASASIGYRPDRHAERWWQARQL